jgi:hypothetical protein
LNKPSGQAGDGRDELAHLLGPARRREVRRIATRLLIALALAAGPLYLVAVRADGLKEMGALAVLTALLVGVPSYLILVATPTAWRARVSAAGLPRAGAGIGLDQAPDAHGARNALAAADGLGLLPDHTTRELGVGLAGKLHGVPASVADVTLARTGGTGRRVVFRGLLIRFDLPRATGAKATIRPRPGPVGRALAWLGARLRGRRREAVRRGEVYTVVSDDPDGTAAWITPAVLRALARIGRAEGRRLDTTTFASIAAGLLTRDMGAKAVTAGLADDVFYLAVDRRASLIRGPHPFATPSRPETLLRRWDRCASQALEPLDELLETAPFRA